VSVLETSTSDHILTLALNRPDVRNALNEELIRALTSGLRQADEDEDVRVIVLTGADPAFCAGLDLKAIESGELDIGRIMDADVDVWEVLRQLRTPVIGAVNGVAITGGLELVLGCDFLIASERAAFIDTHARVGIHPSGGLTTMLPQAVGLRRAKEMSFTGNAMDAEEAWRCGLVNHVVAHDELLDVTYELAADISEIEPQGLRTLNETYRLVSESPVGEGRELEKQRAREVMVDAAEVGRRRKAVTERGRQQAAT
jgi:enoyl-CoA hydratase